MNYNKLEDLQIANNQHGVDARMLMGLDYAKIMHIALNPGEELKLHTTPCHVAFFVIEGNGVLTIGEEEREFSANTAIESPANIPHKWENRSTEKFRVLVIKFVNEK